jgi:hypothetical protein
MGLALWTSGSVAIAGMLCGVGLLAGRLAIRFDRTHPGASLRMIQKAAQKFTCALTNLVCYSG